MPTPPTKKGENMNSLVIGKGQVGSSLYEVVKDSHRTLIRDIEDIEVKDVVTVLHLCFPYSDKFVEIANKYIEQYKPKLTINHSSVAPGTTEKLNGLVCYSPIRGRHPKLARGIKAFDKFIAGKKEATDIASKYFKECSMNTVVLNESSMKTLEFCKLMANIRYGYEICFMQEAERIAKKLNCDIGTFQLWESSYNKGYAELQEHNYIRPILYGGFIGGHCVMQNIDVMETMINSELFDWMKFSNFKKKNELDKEAH
jgi:UDP-N-acetyl-D-mannosaminuronate dehydrogenase